MSAGSYPHRTTIHVAFRDIDVMGHVNNAVYLSYLETARIGYVLELIEQRDLAAIPIILGEVTITYRSPALFGEQLTIGSGITRFGGKSFNMIHRIEAGDGRLIATSRTVLVMYDYTTQGTVPVSDGFKQRVLAFQGSWQPPE